MRLRDVLEILGGGGVIFAVVALLAFLTRKCLAYANERGWDGTDE